jgi:hypothetical protein
MMKRVVCDETFPLLHCNSSSTMKLHKLVETTTTTTNKHSALRRESYEKMSTSKSKVLHDNNGTSSTPPLPTHTTASMMKDYLDVNFYSIFPRRKTMQINSLLPSF